MPLVRTTFQPSVVLSVGDTEFADLLAQGVVYIDWRDLYVTFLNFPTDGDEVDLPTVPSIRIQGPSPSTSDVVATTTTGVLHVGEGRYLYRWSQVSPTPAAGTYTVTWSGTDSDSVAATATDSVVVP